MSSSVSASSSQSTNEGANQSTVYGSGSVTILVGNFSGMQSHGRVYIGDTYYDIDGPTAMSAGNSWSWSASRTYTHGANGYRGDVGVSVYFWIDGTSLHANSATAATQGAIDYVRLPSAPNAPTLSRSSDGSTITMSTNSPSSPVTVSNFFFAYSTDNSNWNAAAYTGNSTPSVSNWSVPSSTTGYYIRAQAYSTEGWSAAGPSTFIAGVPSAPSSISATRTGRNVTVTIGGSATNGGSAVTSYKVQYTTDGTTWTGLQDITSGTYTYTSLPPALTYVFRAYAVNATGNSATTSSGNVFVPAGGKRFDGTTWNTTNIARRFDGSGWVDLSIARRFNGTDWVDLT